MTCADELIQKGPRNKGLSRALQVTEKVEPMRKTSDLLLELAADVHAEFARPKIPTWWKSSDGLVLVTPGED